MENMNRIDSLLRRQLRSCVSSTHVRFGHYQPRNCSSIDPIVRQRNTHSRPFRQRISITMNDRRIARIRMSYCLLFDTAVPQAVTIVGTKRGIAIWSIRQTVWKHAKFPTRTELRDRAVKYKLLNRVNVMYQLDEGYSLSVCQHNEIVDKNRHVLPRLIDAITFIRFRFDG